MRDTNALSGRLPVLLALLVFGAASAFAGGGREVETKISLTRPSTYISPSGPADARHSLEISNIQLKIDANGVIKRYDFFIYDKAGQVVYSKSDVQTKGRGFLADTFNVGAIPSVSLPAKITWSGLDQAGKTVPDGEYFYQLTAVDSWGFSASTPPLSVVVDSVAPVIKSLGLAASIVSPNGDGQKDQLVIHLETGPATHWVERVIGPDGKEVWNRKTDFAGDTDSSDMPLPADSAWDPLLASDGSRLSDPPPEGSYVYELSGTDHAGNRVSKQLPFRISYAGSLISATIADGIEATNAGRGLVFLPVVAETAGASAWSLEIADQAGAVWRRFSGTGLIPHEIAFNGHGKAGRPDLDSDPLKDGRYVVRLRQEYDSGFAATEDSLAFLMDSTPPSASLVLNTADLPSNPVLTPWFGGQHRSRLQLQLATQEDLGWVFELANLDGKQPAYRFLAMGGGGTPNQFDLLWDGTVPEGSHQIDPATGADTVLAESITLPNGRWSIRAVARDAAGNTGGSAAINFVRQAGPLPELQVETDTRQISPGVAGRAEQVRLKLDGLEPAMAEQLALSVENDAGQEIYATRVRPELPLTWQGQQASGLPAPEGLYRLKVTVAYRNGDESALSAGEVTLAARADSLPGAAADPVAAARTVTELIARAIGLVADTPLVLDPAVTPGVPVSFKVTNSSGFPDTVSWVLRVKNQGATIWQASGAGSPPAAIDWDGRCLDGSMVGGLAMLHAQWEMSGPGQDAPVVVEKRFMTGIPVLREGGRLRVMAPDILFQGNNADPFDGDEAQIAANIDLLRRLGDRLAKLGGQRIVIEGYATYAYELTPKSMDREQRLDLIPLSHQRAHEVRKALFITGVDWNRMDIQALGGTNPVVPYGEKASVWKNRRVIMYLEK